MTHSDEWSPFTPARPLTTEGARCGLITCTICGVTLLLDPADPFDVEALHLNWHDHIDQAQHDDLDDKPGPFCNIMDGWCLRHGRRHKGQK